MKSLIFILAFYPSILFAESYAVELISALGADQKALLGFQNNYHQAKLQYPEKLELLWCMEGKVNLELMQETLKPIYAKKYSESDARKIISFLNSDLGKRIKLLSAGQLAPTSFEEGLSAHDKEELKIMETGLLSPKIKSELEQEFYEAGRELGRKIGAACQPQNG